MTGRGCVLATNNYKYTAVSWLLYFFALLCGAARYRLTVAEEMRRRFLTVSLWLAAD